MTKKKRVLLQSKVEKAKPVTKIEKQVVSPRGTKSGKIILGILALLIIAVEIITWSNVLLSKKTDVDRWMFSATVVDKIERGNLVEVSFEDLDNSDNRVWYEGRGLTLPAERADWMEVGKRYSILVNVDSPDNLLWVRELS